MFNVQTHRKILIFLREDRKQILEEKHLCKSEINGNGINSLNNLQTDFYIFYWSNIH